MLRVLLTIAFSCVFSASLYASQFVIVIDPGHGGKDTGAIAKNGVYEKTVTLAVAKKLGFLLSMTPGVQPYLTRTTDHYVGLWQRTQLARKADAGLFISLHADAFSRTAARGASVFVVSDKGASTSAAKWLAQRENRSDFANGIAINDKSDHVASVLIDVVQGQTQKASHYLALAMLQELEKVAKLHGGEVERAPFLVLKSPDIPSVLIEMGFLTNPTEAKLLKQNRYQAKMAKAIYWGILIYLKRYAPQDNDLAKYGLPKTLYYRVRKGDTVSGIAHELGWSWQQFKAITGLKSTHLYIGQKIAIPVAKLVV